MSVISDLEYHLRVDATGLHAKFAWGDVRLEDYDVDVRESGYDSSELIVKVRARLSYTLGDRYSVERLFEEKFDEFFQEHWANCDEDDEYDSEELYDSEEVVDDDYNMQW